MDADQPELPPADETAPTPDAIVDVSPNDVSPTAPDVPLEPDAFAALPDDDAATRIDVEPPDSGIFDVDPDASVDAPDVSGPITADSAPAADFEAITPDVLDTGSSADDVAAAGCTTAADCPDDGDACTAAICANDGACAHAALPCPAVAMPGDGCRVYACDADQGCVSTSIADCVPCDAGLYATEALADAFCAGVDACRVGGCDDALGRCVFTPNDCDDQDDCTLDGCAPPLGCQHTPIAGCGAPLPCTGDADCDDDSACSIDVCSPDGTCAYSALSCDDGDACSVDVCAPSWGCLHGPIACDDDDACTTDSCDATEGCAFEVVSCDDDDVCTLDGCDSSVGCTASTLSCDDDDACTVDSCDAATGCDHEPALCDDGDLCTLDVCEAASGCDVIPTFCDDGEVCTSDACSPASGECVYAEVNCDDKDACTNDRCQPGTGCVSEAVICDPCSSEKPPKGIYCGWGPVPFCSTTPDCYVPSCSPSYGCSFYNKCEGCWSDSDCSDSNACTINQCLPCGPGGGTSTACSTTFKVCSDGSPCTLDQCNSSTGACTFPPRDCSDPDPCTFDSCDPAAGGCQHLPGACDG